MSTSKRTNKSDGYDSVDLTESIMQRLGYTPVTPEIARTILLRKWAGRTAFLIVILAAIFTGTILKSQSTSARQPHGPTIPSAINHDLMIHGAAIDRAIRSIKNLTPKLDVVPVMDVPGSIPIIDDQSVPVQVGSLISQHKFGWV